MDNLCIFAVRELAKPLNDAQMCGSFFYIPKQIVVMIPFNKPYKTPEELILLLKSRGLCISNSSKAKRYLEYIGYYRLSAYMYPFLKMPKEAHIYKEGATFDKVLMLYRFDKKLRLLSFNEIEKVEVAVRSAIVNITCSMLRNSFWMTEVSNFSDNNKFLRTLSLIDNELHHSREDFILHFRKNYSNRYPPAWILSEILPFGVMTNIYSNLKVNKVKKSISKVFGLQVAPFESWLTIITGHRNACCHHSRVWNKQYSIRPMLPNKIEYPWINLPTDTQRVYFTLCIIKYFLNVISPTNDMQEKLHNLFLEFQEIDLNALGFPKGWEQEPLWIK